MLPTLRWQYDLTWRLAQYHLPKLTTAMCLWEPALGSWNVRQRDDASWHPDWADTEPDPVPPVTIGWLTWHLIWWWSGILAAVRNETPPSRETVFWPGDAAATVAAIESLAAAWSDLLAHLQESDLAHPVTHPWREPRPLCTALAWVNSELMKNVAEIGIMHHLYEAQRHSPA